MSVSTFTAHVPCLCPRFILIVYYYFVAVVVDYLVTISLALIIMSIVVHLWFAITHSVCSISVIAIGMFYLKSLNYCTATTTCHYAILTRLIVANIIHLTSSIFITFYIFTHDNNDPIVVIIVAMMLSIKLIVFC